MSTWIFLRGLMREMRHWGDFPHIFAEDVATATIHLPELPGNGRLHRLTSPTRIEDMVEYYRRTLAAYALVPPYHLLALSMGAMVAVAWAEKYPAELAGCVLINTSLRPFSPFHQRLRWHVYFDLFRLACMNSDAAQRERLILQLTSSRSGEQAELLDAWKAYQLEYPVSRRNALRQLAAAARYRAPAGKPPVPMLVLAGARDRLVDPRCSHCVAAQWQTDFVLHPEAGHDLPLDDGPWVAHQVRNWLHSGRP